MNLILAGAGPRRMAVGRCGIGEKRREGDGVTPAGTWPVRRVLYRADKLTPKTALPIAPIAPDDGWCDAPNDPAYNTQIKLPYPARHERLWRDDDLYDLVVVLGFNDAPVIPGAGSAIFLHIARPDFGPTEGCVAVGRDELLAVVAALTPGATATITP
jgi:L,D-peptidoglycan transpeptidase YkuD (ErfK/YbiS/YcfS/YnhG family)